MIMNNTAFQSYSLLGMPVAGAYTAVVFYGDDIHRYDLIKKEAK